MKSGDGHTRLRTNDAGGKHEELRCLFSAANDFEKVFLSLDRIENKRRHRLVNPNPASTPNSAESALPSTKVQF